MNDTSLSYKRGLSILRENELGCSPLKASTPTFNRQLGNGRSISVWNMSPICVNDKSQNDFFDADRSRRSGRVRKQHISYDVGVICLESVADLKSFKKVGIVEEVRKSYEKVKPRNTSRSRCLETIDSRPSSIKHISENDKNTKDLIGDVTEDTTLEKSPPKHATVDEDQNKPISAAGKDTSRHSPNKNKQRKFANANGTLEILDKENEPNINKNASSNVERLELSLKLTAPGKRGTKKKILADSNSISCNESGSQKKHSLVAKTIIGKSPRKLNTSPNKTKQLSERAENDHSSSLPSDESQLINSSLVFSNTTIKKSSAKLKTSAKKNEKKNKLSSDIRKEHSLSTIEKRKSFNESDKYTDFGTGGDETVDKNEKSNIKVSETSKTLRSINKKKTLAACDSMDSVKLSSSTRDGNQKKLRLPQDRTVNDDELGNEENDIIQDNESSSINIIYGSLFDACTLEESNASSIIMEKSTLKPSANVRSRGAAYKKKEKAAEDKETSHVESQLLNLSAVERPVKLMDTWKSGGNKKTIANSSTESDSENTDSLVMKTIEEKSSRKLNSSALQKNDKKKQSSLVENDGSSSLPQPLDQSLEIANSKMKKFTKKRNVSSKSKKIKNKQSTVAKKDSSSVSNKDINRSIDKRNILNVSDENRELGTGSIKNRNNSEEPQINHSGTSKPTEETSPAECETVNSRLVPVIATVEKSSLQLSAGVIGDESRKKSPKKLNASSKSKKIKNKQCAVAKKDSSSVSNKDISSIDKRNILNVSDEIRELGTGFNKNRNNSEEPQINISGSSKPTEGTSPAKCETVNSRFVPVIATVENSSLRLSAGFDGDESRKKSPKKLNPSSKSKKIKNKQSTVAKKDSYFLSNKDISPLDRRNNLNVSDENRESGTGSNKNLNNSEESQINISGTSKTSKEISAAECESVDSSLVPVIATFEKYSLQLNASVKGDENKRKHLSRREELLNGEMEIVHNKNDSLNNISIFNGTLLEASQLDESMESTASSINIANTTMDKFLVKPNVRRRQNEESLPDFMKVFRKSSQTKRQSLSNIVERLKNVSETKIINKETGSHEPSNEDKVQIIERKTSVAKHNQSVVVDASCSAPNRTLKDSSMKLNTNGRGKRKFGNEVEVADYISDKENVANNWPEGCQRIKRPKNTRDSNNKSVEVTEQKKSFTQNYMRILKKGKNLVVPHMNRGHLCNILNHTLPEISDTINLFNATTGDFVDFDYHFKFSKFQPADGNKVFIVASVNTFSGSRVFQIKIKPKGETPFLIVDKCDRTLVVLEGIGVVQVHQTMNKIEKHDCIIIPRGVVHNIYNTSENEDLKIHFVDSN